MQKFIKSDKIVHAQPVEVVPHETIDVSEPTVQDVVIPEGEAIYKPITFASDRLTWSKSSINQVVYNATVKQWMDYDPAFANWVRSCIMLHADNDVRQTDTVCNIPDMWKDEIGEKITIVSANCIPERNGFEYKAGVIHVMA